MCCRLYIAPELTLTVVVLAFDDISPANGIGGGFQAAMAASTGSPDSSMGQLTQTQFRALSMVS